MIFKMLVTFAMSKLEITICHSNLKEINVDFKITWKRMRSPDLPKRPRNKYCPVSLCDYSPKRR